MIELAVWVVFGLPAVAIVRWLYREFLDDFQTVR